MGSQETARAARVAVRRSRLLARTILGVAPLESYGGSSWYTVYDRLEALLAGGVDAINADGYCGQLDLENSAIRIRGKRNHG